jgi:hypothetical protein
MISTAWNFIRTGRPIWILFLLHLSGMGAHAVGEEENPYIWKSHTKSVAVFKNGMGFFMREGNVKLRDGWCVAKEVPAAAFGTLAIYALDEKEMVDIVGSGPGEIVDFDDRHESKDTAAKRKRLEESLYLNIQLNYKVNGNGELTVTAAINIAHEKREKEAGRELKVHSPSRDVYLDQVTLEGELMLKNFEKRAVTVVIKNPIQASRLWRIIMGGSLWIPIS